MDYKTPEFMKTYFVACTPATLVFWLLMALCTVVVLISLINQGITSNLVLYILVNLVTIFVYSFMVTTFCRAWGEAGGWLYLLAPLIFAVLMAVLGGMAQTNLF
jgi:hypothetical protein